MPEQEATDALEVLEVEIVDLELASAARRGVERDAGLESALESLEIGPRVGIEGLARLRGRSLFGAGRLA